jgi:hypothetical protein
MFNRLKILSISLFLLIATASHAEDNVCAVLLCMSGPGSAAPHACKPHVDSYFDIKVYHRGTFRTKYDPIGTAKKRYETVLEQCGSARQIDRDRVHMKFGHLERNPFFFY